ncbi:MAG TPA: succinate dehydrogenase [Burkholderiales bacterium]|nr:succinate dehydrogenase [Burkholderiales bacterium]
MSGAGLGYAPGPAAAPGANARFETWLWIAQRASAAVLALCVLVHLVTIIYAVHHGLSGAAILARTRGNVGALAFYTLYVLAIAVHAPIGLRALCQEWLGWRNSSLNWVIGALALALFVFGLRAGAAVFVG